MQRRKCRQNCQRWRLPSAHDVIAVQWHAIPVVRTAHDPTQPIVTSWSTQLHTLRTCSRLRWSIVSDRTDSGFLSPRQQLQTYSRYSSNIKRYSRRGGPATMDYAAKGRDLQQQAEKKLKGGAFSRMFSGSSREEAAAELLERAATQFKLAKACKYRSHRRRFSSCESRCHSIYCLSALFLQRLTKHFTSPGSLCVPSRSREGRWRTILTLLLRSWP